MSFGFSPSDICLLINGIARPGRLIEGETVEGFADCTARYQLFARTAAQLNDFVEADTGDAEGDSLPRGRGLRLLLLSDSFPSSPLSVAFVRPYPKKSRCCLRKFG
jgi:hypothetical protein